MTAIRTIDGFSIDFLATRNDQITIRSIARGLANTCRFAGQVREFYSVAQHSVLVSNLVPDYCAMQALLHDAPEAFCHDVTTPLKRLLPDYQQIEARLWRCIAERFGIPERLFKQVKEADAIALAIEDRDIRKLPETETAKRCPIAPIQALPPNHAHDLFMNRYYELQRSTELEDGA